jgi:probable phosphomutase (TIGR03848 family)
MTTFFFVRHGVTSHTGHKLSGWMPGIHLNDDGRRQAEAAAAQLIDVKFKAIYSSPIERCFETAEIIAAPHRMKVQTDDALGEVEYGKWTDRSLKSLMRTKLWTTVQRWPAAMRFPEGETLRAVQARAVDAVEDLKAKHPKGPVCCVSHGDVIKLVVAHYLGVHIDLYQRIMIGPASVSIVALGEYGPAILSLNSQPVAAPEKNPAASLPGEPA